MSETKIGIDVQASTNAAKAQLGALAAETLQFVEAGDAAGKSQKKLGKEVAETRARQLEAVEALRRVRSAQAEHNFTVQAFGPRSAQAKASLQALTLAQEESKRASVQAAKALENVAAKATEAARAEGDKLTPATRRLASQLQAMGQDADKAAAELRRMDLAAVAASKGTSQLSKGISALTIASGNLIAGGVSRAVHGIGEAMSFTLKSAIDFESSMADVSKVVDGLKTPTGEATAAYRDMEGQLFSLSEKIAVAPEGFARIAAAAGQAGIAGSELTTFAEQAAKTAVAFDITAESAGEGLAKLRTGLKLNQEGVMELAGTLNHLSNKMASSAPELLDAVQRVGSIGKAANVTGQEIAALSSAMISAGAGSEMAATGTKNFLLALAAGESATTHQLQAFKALGLEAETVAANVTSRDMVVRAEQMKQVVERLAGLADSERISNLKKLFGGETVGTIGPLATNLDLLSQSLEFAADRTAALGSVQAEFDSRSNTTANTLQLLKNNLSVTAITIGTELLPEIATMAKSLSAWVKENRELIRDNVIGFIHGVRDAVQGLAPYVTAAGKTLGFVIQMFGGVERAIGPVITGLGALRIASTLALGPWGVLAAGIIAGAVAIGEAMADAEKRSMSMIRVAMRLRDKGLTSAGVEGASAQELLRQKQEILLLQEKNKVIQGDMRGKTPAAIRQAEKERQADMVALKERQKIIDAALATKTKELETSIKVRREAEAQAEAEKTRMDRLKLELGYLNSLDKLSASQARRKAALEKGGIEGAGGEEPKKGKGGSRAKKDPNAFASDLMSFDSDIANYKAKLAKDIREQDLADQEAKQAELEALFEREVQLHAGKVSRYDQEIELLQARHSMEVEQVDAVFFTLSVENEAEAQRQRLMDERMKRELAYARWAVANAKNSKQREEAQTHLESLQHKKRIADAQKAHAAEEAQQAQRAKVFEGVRTHVLGVGQAVVEGIKAQQAGEKGAIAALTAEYLKGVAIRMAIKGAEETVLGVSALAGILTAGLAPPHFAAAGMAFAAAAAAGGGAAVAGGIANAQGYGGKKGADEGVAPGSSGEGINPGGINRPGSSSGKGGDDDGIPTSYAEKKNYQMRNQPTTSAKESGGTVINYNFPGATVLGGTQEQVGIALDRLTANARRSAGKTR